MADQQATVSELASLRSTMGELVAYCQALQAGAAAHAYGLPAQWQGPAMAAFLSSFGNWSTLAAGMISQAESLQKQVEAAEKAYEKTIEGLDKAWNEFTNTLPKV